MDGKSNLTLYLFRFACECEMSLECRWNDGKMIGTIDFLLKSTRIVDRNGKGHVHLGCWGTSALCKDFLRF